MSYVMKELYVHKGKLTILPTPKGAKLDFFSILWNLKLDYTLESGKSAIPSVCDLLS